MVDANHAYNLNDALYVGRGLDELDIFWFEEPVHLKIMMDTEN